MRRGAVVGDRGDEHGGLVRDAAQHGADPVVDVVELLGIGSTAVSGGARTQPTSTTRRSTVSASLRTVVSRRSGSGSRRKGRSDRDTVEPGDRDSRAATDRGDRRPRPTRVRRRTSRAQRPGRPPRPESLASSQPGTGSPSVASGMSSQAATLAVVGAAAANRPLEIASQPSAGHAYERMLPYRERADRPLPGERREGRRGLRVDVAPADAAGTDQHYRPGHRRRRRRPLPRLGSGPGCTPQRPLRRRPAPADRFGARPQSTWPSPPG